MSNNSIPIRVYIEDTDAGGIVYYANYLRYMERARTEWLRACGIELDLWQEQHRTLFVVQSVQIDYRTPARFNDLLQADCQLVMLKSASLVCEQRVLRDATLLTRATVRLVCVDADTLSPRAIPKEIKEALNS